MFLNFIKKQNCLKYQPSYITVNHLNSSGINFSWLHSQTYLRFLKFGILNLENIIYQKKPKDFHFLFTDWCCNLFNSTSYLNMNVCGKKYNDNWKFSNLTVRTGPVTKNKSVEQFWNELFNFFCVTQTTCPHSWQNKVRTRLWHHIIDDITESLLFWGVFFCDY